MRVDRKQVKKRMIFVLLLALMVSMARPSGSYADEPEGTDTVEQEDRLAPESSAIQQTGGEQSESRADILLPKAGSNIENETKIEESAADEKNLKIDNSDEKHLNSMKLESKDEDSEQQKERAGQFEEDLPVIERVEFGQKQTTVASDAEITLSVYAYDASGIKDVKVEMILNDSTYSQSMKWNKGKSENEYVCTYQLDGKTSGKLSVSSIRVIDENNNTTSMDISELEGYWVNIEESEKETIQVKSFDFAQNGKTIQYSSFYNEASMRLELQKPIEQDSVWLRFEADGRYFEVGLSASDNGTTHSIFDKIAGTSAYNFRESNEYTLTLQEVYIAQGDFGQKITAAMENKEAYSLVLNVEKSVEDSIIITSVSMDKKGENVKPGEEINIIVEVETGEGIELPGGASVIFNPAVTSIEPHEKRVDLELNEKDQKYYGTLKIEDMYPCEWYIGAIYVHSSAETNDDAFTYDAGFPYYVRVYDGEAFVNPEFDVEFQFMALDENGAYQSIGSVTKKNVQRRQTLKEVGVTLPGMSSGYSGLTQIGWMERNGKEITEDTTVLNEHFGVYAKYDKGVYQASYKYLNNAGEWSETFCPIVYEHGATYGEVEKKAREFMPEDMTKDYTFSNWGDDQFSKDDKVVSGVEGEHFIAQFSGVTVLDVHYTYYDQKGSMAKESKSFAVEEGTSYKKAIEMLNASEAPVSYKGLRFKEWDAYAYLGEIGEGLVHSGEDFVMNPVYENCLVRYIINGSRLLGESEGENIFCQVAEKGETVTALTSFEGFGEVTWDKDAAPDKTFVVVNHRTFWGHAEASSAIDPGKPGKPSKPSDGSSSGSGNKPGETTESKLPDSAVNSIIKAIKDAEQGENIKVNMGSKSVISKEILEAARGKDVSVILEMEGYSWTINGRDIMAANLQDIDLRVIKNTDHIPGSTVKALAGNNPCMQITLVHEGNFGFKAVLNIGVGSEYAGKYGNLYYHDSAGKMVFVNAGQIDSNGSVSLEFSHASDYLLVMSNQAMSQADVPADLMPAGTDQNGAQSAAGTGIRKSAKTGDYAMIYPWLLLCLAAMGSAVYMFRRKRA